VADIEAIYREHYPRFLRFAVANTSDVERGRDAVHDAFVRAIRSLSNFRGEAGLETWVWRILINACATTDRHTSSSLGDEELLSEPAVQEPDWPEVRTALAWLPERQRTVLFLRHYADLDYDQIAATLGIARGTVAATLHTAHSRLREALGEVRT
jgi:RNA polymerase sigma factor (sigma-70 family)